MSNQDGVADFPATVTTYANKADKLFRISKGTYNPYDSISVNLPMPAEERVVAMDHIIFIGEGALDVSAFRQIMRDGGLCNAVYENSEPSLRKAEDPICHDRVRAIASADYSPDGEIENLVLSAIDKAAADQQLHC